MVFTIKLVAHNAWLSGAPKARPVEGEARNELEPFVRCRFDFDLSDGTQLEVSLLAVCYELFVWHLLRKAEEYKFNPEPKMLMVCSNQTVEPNLKLQIGLSLPTVAAEKVTMLKLALLIA